MSPCPGMSVERTSLRTDWLWQQKNGSNLCLSLSPQLLMIFPPVDVPPSPERSQEIVVSDVSEVDLLMRNKAFAGDRTQRQQPKAYGQYGQSLDRCVANERRLQRRILMRLL